MMEGNKFGPYYKFPLRISPKIGDMYGTSINDSVTMCLLTFKRQGNGWRCLGCAEAGNEWHGHESELDAHCKAHQMGIDYALMMLEKIERTK
jgi:hypothetical protein